MKTDKKNGMTKETRTIIIVIVVSILLILATIGGSVFYVLSNMGSNDGASDTKSTSQSATNNVKSGNMPDNPNSAAVKWLNELLADTAKQFPSKTFTEGNDVIDSLTKGDASKVPDSIKNRIELGTNSTGMSIGRDVLNSSTYLGLMMFSNAHQSTVNAGTQLSGDAFVSYDTNNNIVYIPVQAVAASDKNIVFQVRWTGKEWKLMGDPLGWQTYILLMNQQSSASSSSSK